MSNDLNKTELNKETNVLKDTAPILKKNQTNDQLDVKNHKKHKLKTNLREIQSYTKSVERLIYGRYLKHKEMQEKLRTAQLPKNKSKTKLIKSKVFLKTSKHEQPTFIISNLKAKFPCLVDNRLIFNKDGQLEIRKLKKSKFSNLCFDLFNLPVLPKKYQMNQSLFSPNKSTRNYLNSGIQKINENNLNFFISQMEFKKFNVLKNLNTANPRPSSTVNFKPIKITTNMDLDNLWSERRSLNANSNFININKNNSNDYKNKYCIHNYFDDKYKYFNEINKNLKNNYRNSYQSDLFFE